MANASEFTFQNDMIKQLVSNGWLPGKHDNYNRELALYEEDVLGFIKETQDEQRQRSYKLHLTNPEQKTQKGVAFQLEKVNLGSSIFKEVTT